MLHADLAQIELQAAACECTTQPHLLAAVVLPSTCPQTTTTFPHPHTCTHTQVLQQGPAQVASRLTALKQALPEVDISLLVERLPQHFLAGDSAATCAQVSHDAISSVSCQHTRSAATCVQAFPHPN
jgi:hypothetical protein